MHQVRTLEGAAEVGGVVVSMTLFFHTFDVRAKLTQLFVEMLVAAVDVVNATNLRHSLRFQSGENERGRGAKIARHYRRPEKSFHSVDDGSGAFNLHLRAHALQFRNMHVTLRENVFGNR